jgi:glycosyltransferase involved in cell wall biosynthesis
MRCPALSELPPPPAVKTGWPWTEGTPDLTEVPLDGYSWPRLSIITPSYNQGQFLEETIRSVLLQGYPDLEYIIIDGGSTDETVNVIKKYEPWLAHWVSEKDRGQSQAINKGLERATGEFAACQNSDDIYWPKSLRSVGGIVAPGDIDIMFGTGDILDDYGERHPPVCPIPEPQIDVLIRFWKGPSNILPSQGFFCRLELLKKIGLFNEKYHYKMDLDVICRLLEIVPRQRIARIDDILAGYRIYDTSKTGNMSSQKAVEEGIEISSRYWEQVSGGAPEKIAREAKRGKGFMALCRAGIAAEKGNLGTTLKELIRAYVNYPRLGITHSNLNILKRICLPNWMGR